MTDQVIVFKNEDGTISICNPAWGEQQEGEEDGIFLMRIAALTANGRDYDVMERADVPVIVGDNDPNHNNDILLQLADIDRKSIRAMADFILTGSDFKIRALQEHADALRQQLRKKG